MTKKSNGMWIAPKSSVEVGTVSEVNSPELLLLYDSTELFNSLENPVESPEERPESLEPSPLMLSSLLDWSNFSFILGSFTALNDRAIKLVLIVVELYF